MPRQNIRPHDERRDERNIARLGIISVQSRIDDTLRNWTAEFSIEGRPYRVECAAPYGRPHGIDTDLILAIQTLFIRTGCPEHNWLHTTAYELRGVAGLPDNGRTYQRLKDSLKRLWGTGFMVAEGWFDPQRGRRVWSSDSLRYIERVRYHELDREPEELPGLDPSSTLSIRLGEQLADSIRARHVQVLDGQLLYQLEQPPARALYRLLEAHRTDAGGQRRLLLEVGLQDWRLACGIQSERPEIVRRALQPAHDELRATGYLRDVQIQGRGKAQVLSYHFTEDDAPDQTLVELLIGVGVSRATAVLLATEHGEAVETAVAFVRHRQAAGQVKNPGGLVVDYLRQPAKYVLPERLHSAPVDEAARKVRALQAIQVAEQQTEQAARQERQRLAALPPAEQFSALQGSLKVLLRPLGKEAWAGLERLCLSGQLSALDVREEAARAMGRLELQSYLDDLQAQIADAAPD
ncbi:replication initiator protein A [Deinococcus sp. 14RED07]|uniref:replication initiator protein A n=1 Tax=unclassified Deinococcus TaxID=2623546 RepID=UPI001E2E60EB|nr:MULTISPECIES: replication initiator protein A [unclassified Deinococcus]MCD0165152.1 replication initiator protein A [Deinococcus sp. 12RED42]MCD0175373.1 replication initiator protein A [Deinococcus sp. 14RED07]